MDIYFLPVEDNELRVVRAVSNGSINFNLDKQIADSFVENVVCNFPELHQEVITVTWSNHNIKLIPGSGNELTGGETYEP